MLCIDPVLLSGLGCLSFHDCFLSYKNRHGRTDPASASSLEKEGRQFPLSLFFFFFFSPSLSLSAFTHSHLLPPHTKMPTAYTINPQSTIIVIALTLVPIIVLFCCLFLAIACSEFWSGRRCDRCCCFCIVPRYQQQQKHTRSSSSDTQSQYQSHTRNSRSVDGTETSEADLEFQSPVLGREQV